MLAKMDTIMGSNLCQIRPYALERRLTERYVLLDFGHKTGDCAVLPENGPTIYDYQFQVLSLRSDYPKNSRHISKLKVLKYLISQQ